MSSDDSSPPLLYSLDKTKTQQTFPDTVLSYIMTFLSPFVRNEGAVTLRLFSSTSGAF
jgi:hypothetical protein